MAEENQELENKEPEDQDIENQEEQLEDQPPEPNEDEVRASGNGWTDLEAWEAKGGHRDDWVSAKKFNDTGDMIGKIRHLERRLDDREKDFGARLDQQSQLHKAQMKVTLADLEAKRDDAIDLADRDKANAIQGQIDEVRATSVDVEPEATASNDQTVLDDWNATNTWITDEDSPKAAYALMRFNSHLQSGKGSLQAIEQMESEVSRKFPDKNDRRENAPSVEGGRSKPGRKASVKLSWDQLKPEELKWFNAISWESKEVFLQTVEDERKAQA